MVNLRKGKSGLKLIVHILLIFIHLLGNGLVFVQSSQTQSPIKALTTVLLEKKDFTGLYTCEVVGLERQGRW